MTLTDREKERWIERERERERERDKLGKEEAMGGTFVPRSSSLMNKITLAAPGAPSAHRTPPRFTVAVRFQGY